MNQTIDSLRRASRKTKEPEPYTDDELRELDERIAVLPADHQSRRLMATISKWREVYFCSIDDMRAEAERRASRDFPEGEPAQLGKADQC